MLHVQLAELNLISRNFQSVAETSTNFYFSRDTSLNNQKLQKYIFTKVIMKLELVT